MNEKEKYENLDEENLELSPNLKQLLVTEVDLIRDTFSVLLVFIEGGVKTGIKFIEEINNDNLDKP